MKKITLLLSLLLIPFQATTEPLTVSKTVSVTTGGTNAIVAMAEYATDANIGVAFSCTGNKPKITLQFGGFPGEHHPVHLYVEHENKITFFSDTVRGSPQAGFHSPVITQAKEIEQFLSLAFKPGALITNNYRGFYLILKDRGRSATNLINEC